MDKGTKLQLIEKVGSLGPSFKITDGNNYEFVSYSDEPDKGRTREEALKQAQAIYRFWLEHGGPERILMENEYKEV